jgi:hypothetical protein
LWLTFRTGTFGPAFRTAFSARLLIGGALGTRFAARLLLFGSTSFGTSFTALSAFLSSWPVAIAFAAIAALLLRTFFQDGRSRSNRCCITDLERFGQQLDLRFEFFLRRFEAGNGGHLANGRCRSRRFRFEVQLLGLALRLLCAALSEAFGNNVAVPSL